MGAQLRTSPLPSHPRPLRDRQTHLLLLVIEVGGGEQVSEDHGRHVHLLVLVRHHRDALAVVEDRDRVVLSAG